MTLTRKVIQEAFDSLETQGLLRKTGEFITGKEGDLQPVYVPTMVSDWLDETGLIEEFLKYLRTTDQQTVRLN